MRNVDSKINSPRFDCCIFLFHSLSAATFSTTSVKTGKARNEQTFSGLPTIADIARRGWHGRKVPKADITALLNQLISAGAQYRRQVEIVGYFWFHPPAFHFASGQISGTSLPL
jgi:hypothetical protein